MISPKEATDEVSVVAEDAEAPPAALHRLPDLLLGASLLVIAAGAAWSAWGIVVPFAADPIGPSAFPIAIAAVLAAAALGILFGPGVAWEWPERRIAGPVAVLAMLGYSVSLTALGFIPATALLCVVVALCFEARPVQALLAGAITAPLLWLLLDRLLDLPLPRGPLGI